MESFRPGIFSLLSRSPMNLVPIERDGSTAAPLHRAADLVRQVIEATVALYDRKGYHPPWIGYLAVEEEGIVGGCGFAGPPSNGEAEIAYFTLPENEGRGIATGMASSLMAMTRTASDQAGIRFIAHTLPQEGPSTSILKKLGFEFEGEIQHPEDGLVWKWRESSPGEA
jgi:RimJ/RimL family protein N-acetyltransferase